MSFKNVEIKKKANVYHEGRVTSRTVLSADGSRKTLGVMLPGSYVFNTDAAEVIDVTQGRCRVKLNDGPSWSEHTAGNSFSVPAHTRFEIEVTELLDYVCHFG